MQRIRGSVLVLPPSPACTSLPVLGQGCGDYEGDSAHLSPWKGE